MDSRCRFRLGRIGPRMTPKEGDKMAVETLTQSLGLPRKESAVYLALLELGTSTVSAVAIAARLNRTTAYDILESLNIKGLVSIVGDRKKRTYTAEHPDTLVRFFEKRAQLYERRAEDLGKLLPQLRGLYNEKGKRPVVRFYEGKHGLEAVYEDTLTSSEPIRAYASVHDMHAALPKYFPEYYQRRAKKGISIRAILPATPEAIERQKNDTAELRESMLVSTPQFDFSPEINLYDDKVAIMSLAEEFGVIIESKEIAEAQKVVFELAWLGAKQVAAQADQKTEDDASASEPIGE